MRPYTMHQVIVLLSVLAAADAGAPCDPTLIQGAVGEYALVPYPKYAGAVQLKCKDDTKQIKVNSLLFPSLICDPNAREWKNVANKFIATHPPCPVEKSITIDCEAAKECDEFLIKGFTNKMKYANNKLECNKKYELLQYTDQGAKESRTLECDPNGKWKSETGDTTVTASQSIIVSKCVVNPCDKDLITMNAGATYTPGPSPTLNCGASGKVLKIYGKSYAALSCDKVDGWKNVPNPAIVKGSKDEFSVLCDDPPPAHCGISKVGPIDPVETPDPSIGITVSCPTDATYGLFFYNQNAETRVTGNDKLTCKEGVGWKVGDTEITSETSTSMKVECRTHCIVQRTPSDCPTGQTCIEDGLTVDAEETPLSSGAYECKNKNVEQAKHALKLNDKYVHSISLTCDAVNGWTDVTGAVVSSDPFTKVKIECGDAWCRVPNLIQCSKNIPDGYFCEIDKGKRSPFHMSIDPNFIGCDTNPKTRLYDNKNKLFYDYKLRCKDDRTWYKSDDPAKTTIVNDTNQHQIICVQPGCNMCSTALPQVTGATPSSLSKFEEGESGTVCSTMKCPPKNLWTIKKEGGTAEEEYVGEVECGAAKPENSPLEFFWYIDGASKTKIIEGSCIAAVSSCTTAAKLETECNAAWKVNCTNLALADAGQIKCEKGRMFYKRKGEKYFEEGPKNIECVKAEGKWKMTASEYLLRGDTVICADANPDPRPVPKPYEDACVVCKKNCVPCIKKSSDIGEDLSSDNETCTIWTHSGNPFKTPLDDITGNLTCTKTHPVWKNEDGKEVGEILAITAPIEEKDSNTLWVILASIGGVIVVVIVFGVIYKVCVSKKKPDDKDEETKRKMLEEGRKKKKKSGDNNDEILDEISVDAPSELKL